MVTQGCLLKFRVNLSHTPLAYSSTPLTSHFRPCPGTASKSVHLPFSWSPSSFVGRERVKEGRRGREMDEGEMEERREGGRDGGRD